MSEQEGVIKYKLNHRKSPLDKQISISEINVWRTILFKLQLIGQIKGRYDGYGFGNISQRIIYSSSDKVHFIISGTQTGGFESISNFQYCAILEACPIKNSIKSAGGIKPSSEALTHASVYQQDKNIKAVIHIHSPEIWKNTKQLKLPYTAADIAYGTPEMANEVKRLFQTDLLQKTHVFSMLGHKDGIIAFSDSIQKTAFLIIKTYSKAIALEQNKQQR
jgi:ribulose-5-phosphate 4-epimerase/fuculose-1-phosphate aldolase